MILPIKFQDNWPFLYGGVNSKQTFKLAAVAAIFDSDPNDFSYFLSTSHQIPPTKFQVNWLSVQKKKFKIHFQDGLLGLLIGTILDIFIYKSLQYFLPSFKSIGLSYPEKFKIDFQMVAFVAILDFWSKWF